MIRAVSLGVVVAITSSIAAAGENLPYEIEDGRVDESTYLGWRIYHSTCHGCHGVDATGTSVAPSLVEKIRNLSARDFSVKVLSRYRITVSERATGGDDKTELRDAFLEQVLRRERGEILMPGWEADRNVKPHVLDIYAYLRARADGALAPGRPEKTLHRE
ncbi:MAG: cytochrome c [Gammaproteobacteria bacterium]|nr:cytochrome c [Gammaproteobacteria bacterium]MDH4313960.1 cytochrome c [Gammaproteobacteria bacterium]